jgi:HEAT repeat protein
MTNSDRSGNREYDEFIAQLSRDPAFERFPTKELRYQLERDPSFVERQRTAYAAQEANRQRYQAAAAPVLAELRLHGLAIDSRIKELRTAKPQAYAVAVPILTRWLPRMDDADVKEDIVRTLSMRPARSAAPALIDEFRRTDNATRQGLHWAIGNALEVLAHDGIAEQLLELSHDRRFGTARQMIVLGLGKLKHPDVVDGLIGLLEDPDVSGHAVSALRKVADPRSRTALEPFLAHSRTWIRNEARKAIAKIDRKDANQTKETSHQ